MDDWRSDVIYGSSAKAETSVVFVPHRHDGNAGSKKESTMVVDELRRLWPEMA
jgi:hypothetical protein